MSASLFRFEGPLASLSPGERQALLTRGATEAGDAAFRLRARDLLDRVRVSGDSALVEMAREFDGVALETLEVPRARCRAALDRLEPALRRAMERSLANITTAHAALVPRAVTIDTEPGVRVGRRPDPLARVGIYAPGGRAAYPSSVLMGAVPARMAGVGEIVLCSPPGADGLPARSILAAAALAGVDRVFRIGGAGAIGAMAYGTATVPRVDRIVGPGNAWVAVAKLQVSSTVAIDAPAGPSELLVIADASAPPRTVAREVLAQAEHDPEAAVVVVALGGGLARTIATAIAELLPAELRCATIAEALAGRGGLCTADSLDEALSFAEAYAPEHLLLAIAEPDAALARVRNAGTVFLGESSSVAFGDYITGANHVLPTGGLARSWSGLSTSDFVRWTTWQQVEPAAAARLAADVAAFAEAEQLPAHAAAARAWADREGETTGVPCAIDLSDNTNLWGVPPAARCALERAGRPVNVARYPNLQATILSGVMAAYLGVDADQIVTGCGSDDVLDSAMRALASPGERLAYLEPTFSMIPVFARLNRLVPVAVPPTGRLDSDADALLATGARIIYLCSPNNPTGAALPRAVIERIVSEAPGFVILDEAYAEYAGTDCIDMLGTSPRMLVTRTMSKAIGLAGLRVGYAAGAPDVARVVAESRGPYKVNAVAERVAAAALTEDLAWVREHVAEVGRLRERFASELRRIGLDPLPSAANFVLVPVSGAAALAGRMRAAGVAVRSFDSLPGIGDALRITIGPWAMLERCIGTLGALREVAR